MQEDKRAMDEMEAAAEAARQKKLAKFRNAHPSERLVPRGVRMSREAREGGGDAGEKANAHRKELTGRVSRRRSSVCGSRAHSYACLLIHHDRAKVTPVRPAPQHAGSDAISHPTPPPTRSARRALGRHRGRRARRPPSQR